MTTMKKKILRYILSIIIIISLATPLIYSFTFFNGFAGQIKPTDYPADWYTINKFLDNDKQDFKVLFFPWHGYMNFKWVNNTNKRIANPAKNFFNKDVISGTTVEIGNIYRQDNASDQLYIDNLLRERENITNFGKSVSILNVKYIILTKEVDFKKYFFLFNQSDLELVKDTEHLYVFKNKNDVWKIYQTNDITDISSEKIPLNYEKVNPVNYKLKEKILYKYMVFTEPYSEDWELINKKPIKAYGTVNAFEGNDKDNENEELIFERFYKINLPSYIISFTTFIILIMLYFDFFKLKRGTKKKGGD